ncbi:glutathione S-transferase N-terminal domain-containing protein [Vibrio fluvialis]|jgi:maleylacetoacetate isomerase|uniref:glutathione S-transferase N-terminal domain-containing protein n=1 Tax=Vibrio fluvialis TaxID=676 RepID=UPI001EECA6FF|nr:glutathione S-transferase N-terminal domain-containing protein [Vibrio fluvialis]EKO3509257.1 glutathione S-transferase N-terminal domain-containing protein [Vibrio fluvialis]EMA2446521.1 glutathione S-transferase N-terminal domain-containing protein [Vibrio fluvialis]MCG6344115.1 glutathione S-transferase N-terminal domain-containing protein [Vibrio fluvialis]MCG6403559.1 glutathione S-transferase N-terminal domain-containing protein [Vibrio fluvialis]
MDIILYSAQGSNSSERVEWALKYKAIAYARVEVTGEQLTSTYLQINPLGYVPALSVNGLVITESMAIIECMEELIPHPPLLGSDVMTKARVREICEYVNGSIHTPQNRSVLKALRPELNEHDKRKLRAQWIAQGLEKLALKLCLDSPFAVGETFSLADIFVATIYKKALQHGARPIAFYDCHLAQLREHQRIAHAEPQSST